MGAFQKYCGRPCAAAAILLAALIRHVTPLPCDGHDTASFRRSDDDRDFVDDL